MSAQDTVRAILEAWFEGTGSVHPVDDGREKADHLMADVTAELQQMAGEDR